MVNGRASLLWHDASMHIYVFSHANGELLWNSPNPHFTNLWSYFGYIDDFKVTCTIYTSPNVLHDKNVQNLRRICCKNSLNNSSPFVYFNFFVRLMFFSLLVEFKVPNPHLRFRARYHNAHPSFLLVWIFMYLNRTYIYFKRYLNCCWCPNKLT